MSKIDISNTNICHGLKEVWGPKKKGPVHLISKHGRETFSDSKVVVARWNEHFQKLLNVPGDIDHAVHYQVKHRWDSNHGWYDMARAIAGLKDDKVPAGDGITAEIWKHGGDNLFSRLHSLTTNAWEVGYVPKTNKNTSFVNIYKKGDRSVCGNYRRFSLLSITGKILAAILLNRLST